MTEIHVNQTPDTFDVELRPDEHDEQMWCLLAHLAEYLWTQFGVPFDCDTVIVRLVYSAEDGALASRPEATES